MFSLIPGGFDSSITRDVDMNPWSEMSVDEINASSTLPPQNRSLESTHDDNLIPMDLRQDLHPANGNRSVDEDSSMTSILSSQPANQNIWDDHTEDIPVQSFNSSSENVNGSGSTAELIPHSNLEVTYPQQASTTTLYPDINNPTLNKDSSQPAEEQSSRVLEPKTPTRDSQLVSFSVLIYESDTKLCLEH
jgi:hypothetical protein